MANWCWNTLTVSGPGHENMAALWRAGNVFSAVAPEPTPFLPQDLAELRSLARREHWLGTIPQQDASWWWRRIHWGTTWDDFEADDEDMEITTTEEATVIHFPTSSTAPMAAIRTMSSVYPHLRFSLKGCAPSDRYAVEGVYQAGKTISDGCYSGGPEYIRIGVESGYAEESLVEDEERLAAQRDGGAVNEQANAPADDGERDDNEAFLDLTIRIGLANSGMCVIPWARSKPGG